MFNWQSIPPYCTALTTILNVYVQQVVITSKLAEGKFLKSYRCKAGGIGYVIKVYTHRDANEDLLDWCEKFTKKLAAICSSLDPIDHPNLLPYQRWMLSTKQPGYQRVAQPQQVYLIREYAHSNLYDRLSTRPFLTRIEKRWIIYQLLKALSQCHSAGICHGDLKSENILATSYNWIFITDFAPFKPTYILDDDPAEFYYYFQSQNRARCYIAPERFYSSSVNDGAGFLRMTPGGAKVDEDKGVVESGASGDRRDTLDDLVKMQAIQADMSQSTKLSHEANGTGSEKNILLSPDRRTNSLPPGTPSPGRTTHVQQPQHLRKSDRGATTSPSLPRSTDMDRKRGRRIGQLTEAMDIFSLGCIIAEVFLDGEPLMDLPDVLQYRSCTTATSRGDNRPSVLQKLDKVDDVVIRKLILHMLSRDPCERKTAQEYLTRMVDNEMLFPSYFEDFLYPLMAKLQTSTTTPDERLELICANYDKAMKYLVGVDDEEGYKFFDVRVTAQVQAERKMKRVVEKEERKRPDEEKGDGGDYKEGGKRTTLGDNTAVNDAQPPQYEERSSPILSVSEKSRKNEEGKLELDTNQERQTSNKEDDNDIYSGLWSKGLDELLKKSTTLLEEMGYSRSGGDGLGSEGVGGGDKDRTNNENNVGYQHVGTIRNQQLESSNGQAGIARTELSPSGGQPAVSEGLIFVVQVVCSTMQHLSFPQNRVLALCLLSRFGRYCDDEARLQRLIPYVISLLEDPAPIVRATSVRCLRSLLLRVGNFPTSDEDFFPLYIFPALQRLPFDSEELVRVAFAECLPTLAEISKKFLDTISTAKLSRTLLSTGVSAAASNQNQNGVDISGKEGNVEGTEAVTALINTNYDNKLSILRKHIARWFILLLSSSDHHSGISGGSSVTSDVVYEQQSFSSTRFGKGLNPPSPSTKLALLREMPRLCLFFGQENTLNSLLPQLIAMLNDRDWALRAAFCEHIPTVCAFVGHIATAEFILPCVENALVDSEEFVTCKAVLCLETLLKLGLLSRYYVLDLLPGSIIPLLAHPGVWPREATVGLVVSVAAFLGSLDASIFLLPILNPYLRYSLDVWGEGKLTKDSLKKALRPPISKVTFQMATQALTAAEGDFKPPAVSSNSSIDGSTRLDGSISSKDTCFPIFHPIEGVENDEHLRQLTSSSDKNQPSLHQEKEQLGSVFSSCDGMLRCLTRYVQAAAVSQPMNDNDRVMLMRWYGSASQKNLVPETRSAAHRWKEYAICLPTEVGISLLYLARVHYWARLDLP